MPSRTTLEPPTALDAPFGELDTAPVVVAPEHPGPGAWAGAPSALRVGSDIYLAYRLRRPVGQGRGYANVVARSADGVRFSTLATVGKDRLGAESLERPALVRTAGGTWRLYVSVATPGTKHWRVDAARVEHPRRPRDRAAADRDAGQRPARRQGPRDRLARRPVARLGVLSPARRPRGDRPDDHRVRDQRRRRRLDVARHRTGRPGRPLGRARRTSRRRCGSTGPAPLAWYDGRATAEQNWEEQTGLATIDSPGRLAPVGDAPAGVSPYGLGGLRYVAFVTLEDGSTRFYVEVTRPDGAHDLRTVLVPAA